MALRSQVRIQPPARLANDHSSRAKMVARDEDPWPESGRWTWKVAREHGGQIAIVDGCKQSASTYSSLKSRSVTLCL